MALFIGMFSILLTTMWLACAAIELLERVILVYKMPHSLDWRACLAEKALWLSAAKSRAGPERHAKDMRKTRERHGDARDEIATH